METHTTERERLLSRHTATMLDTLASCQDTEPMAFSALASKNLLHVLQVSDTEGTNILQPDRHGNDSELGLYIALDFAGMAVQRCLFAGNTDRYFMLAAARTSVNCIDIPEVRESLSYALQQVEASTIQKPSNI